MLWREATVVPLEGAGGLLPLAPVGFAHQGYLPAAAAWQISLDSTEWHHAAMGTLLVLLNTDNKTVAQALNGNLDETAASVLGDTLQVDVVADLVGKALDDPTSRFHARTRKPRKARSPSWSSPSSGHTWPHP